MRELFFDLIHVSIGTKNFLSRTPDESEWGLLYDMAKKQSLLGVLFSGVQRLVNQKQELPEMLYLTWMGMAAKIQQRNDVLNRQCTELGKRLKEKGYKYSILKGQGVAQIYPEHLRGFRQCGDIDVLLWKDGLNHKENRDSVMQLVHEFDEKASGSEHHVHMHFFDDTEVELHYVPSYFCNPWANRRFRRWCKNHRNDMVKCEQLDFMVPNTEYNMVFLLSHTFRHYVSEGIGLRQVMDYYFVLKSLERNGIEETVTAKNITNLREMLDSFNMLKFASAMMWVLHKVFGMEERFMICEPHEKFGRKLLTHIIRGGNFGHHNTDTLISGKSHFGRFVNQLALDLSLALDYPSEALWSPISMIREFLRIRL